MPSGKVHSVSTLVLTAGLGFASYHAGYPTQQVLALVGGTLSGLLLTPDLDIDRGSISNKTARRLGGCFFGLVWSLIWKPYALLIPHRSPLSHFPLIGTALRLGYMVALAWLVLTAFHLVGVVKTPSLPVWWPWAFAGLALSDFLHFVMDKTLRI